MPSLRAAFADEALGAFTPEQMQVLAPPCAAGAPDQSHADKALLPGLQELA